MCQRNSVIISVCFRVCKVEELHDEQSLTLSKSTSSSELEINEPSVKGVNKPLLMAELDGMNLG